MVLVDTSVWIHFLAGRSPYAAELDRLLGLDDVTVHELVYGELLIGDRGGRRKLLAAYERMHQAAMVPHRDVVGFVRDRGLAWPQCGLGRHSPLGVRYCGAIAVMDGRPTFLRDS